MAKRIIRQAIIVHGTEPVSSIVLPADAEGDVYVAEYDGTIVVPDIEDEYGEEYLTLTGCLLVEVTGMEPMPGVGNGWTYVDGVLISPQPYPSWRWDGEAWNAPKPKPDGDFLWDEDAQEWLDAVQAVKDAHPYPDPV